MAKYVLHIENLSIKIRVFKLLSCPPHLQAHEYFFHSMLEGRFTYVLKHFVIYAKLVVLFMMRWNFIHHSAMFAIQLLTMLQLKEHVSLQIVADKLLEKGLTLGSPMIIAKVFWGLVGWTSSCRSLMIDKTDNRQDSWLWII